jgi:hypothetical protein
VKHERGGVRRELGGRHTAEQAHGGGAVVLVAADRVEQCVHDGAPALGHERIGLRERICKDECLDTNPRKLDLSRLGHSLFVGINT